MPKTIRKGQRVAWTTSQGETTGRVEAKLTKPTTIKRFRVTASPDKPKLLVRSERTGAKAAHAAASLRPLGRVSAKPKRRTAR